MNQRLTEGIPGEEGRGSVGTVHDLKYQFSAEDYETGKERGKCNQTGGERAGNKIAFERTQMLN